jgi:outer membrane receptor protein involved in Fe transport
VGDRNKTTLGYEDIDADNGYIELAYEFGNGVTAEWLSGWSNYDRDYALENTNAPFLSNLQARGEEFEQLSSELRFTSSGDGPIEWMVGAYWQDTDLFAWSSSLRANVRRGQRYNEITEDVEYKSVFATVTFNFWDDKMSLDLGARYADVDKSTTIVGYGATWVYNVEPVSAGVGGPPGCTEDDLPIGFDYCAVDPATARIFLPVDPAAGLWTIHFRDTRNTPDEWLPSQAFAVGLTPKDFNAPRIEGPYAESLSDSNTDPQITLRYRPTDNLSFYARYAEAFKVGGFETGQTSIPEPVDFQFEPEEAETIELGVKGTAWDGRFGFEATLFELEVTDLQTTTVSTDPNQTSETVNADQRVRGLEFSTRWAATENLRLDFSGALMDGEMTKMEGVGCTDAEIAAALSDASAPCQLFDGGVLQTPPIDPKGALEDFTSLIDRTGSQAPRTPDWKFVLAADYRVPIADRFELSFHGKSFDQTVKYNEHGDLNLMAGFGDIDGRWVVSVFARNIFEARPSYNAEFDTFPRGFAGFGTTPGTHIGPSSFTTYGVKFTYVMR